MTKSSQTIRTPKYRVVISLFTSLFVIWLMLNSTLAWQVWALGAVLALAGAILLKDIATAYAGISITGRTIFYYFAYLGLFLKELVRPPACHYPGKNISQVRHRKIGPGQLNHPDAGNPGG